MPSFPAHSALLLVSFGGPEGPADVEPFLRNVTRGRNVPAQRLAEVAEHYQRFGGVSPLNGQNRLLLEALRDEFGPHLPVYWGNRNWHPFLAETLAAMAADGVRVAYAFLTSAYNSYSGCRQYREDLARARAAVGPDAPTIVRLRQFHNHPGFVEPMADRVREAVAALPAIPAGIDPHRLRRPQPADVAGRGKWPGRRGVPASARSHRRVSSSSDWTARPPGSWPTAVAVARNRCLGWSPTCSTASTIWLRKAPGTWFWPRSAFSATTWRWPTTWTSRPPNGRRGSGWACSEHVPSAPIPAFVAMVRELVEEAG